MNSTLIQHFYQAIVLEYSLIKSCRPNVRAADHASIKDNDPLLSRQQAFQSFVNKVAQICDNARGGPTVTAVVVLRGECGPIYVFASNGLHADHLNATKRFLCDIFSFVRDNYANIKRKALEKQILWRILLFNLPRLEDYLKLLDIYLEECICDCERQDVPEIQELLPELLYLKERVQFEMDIMSSENARSKFLSDTETLIKAIRSKTDSTLGGAIQQRARDEDLTRSESWCELRHYLGRLLSFRTAAEVIVSTYRIWSELFLDFTVIPLPSGRPSPRPISKTDLTAKEIIESMIADDKTRNICLSQAEEMQKFGLDQLIAEQASKKKFRPIVHAEVLVHNYLLREKILHENEYWNRQIYIGSSKPTCRLCSYYFSIHPDRVNVRATHNNLYPNWRLPDSGIDATTGIDGKEKLSLMYTMTEKIRSDAIRTLDARSSPGKKHDSNTYSGFANSLKYWGGSGTLNIAYSNTFELIDQDDSSDTDSAMGMDEDGGVSLNVDTD